jgi:hypothetical protein
MAMQDLVQQLQSQGRGGDTMLAHITPEEAALLEARGGSGTVNPNTGLPEFGFFSDLWRGFKNAIKKIAPIIMPAIAIFAPQLIPAVGAWLGASAATASVVGAAALSAGVTLAAGGDLKQVLTSGALAGLTTFITPIVGNALSKTITSVTGTALSAGTASLIGSAAVTGGMAAIRGGSLKQVLAAVATGAASNYLTNLASQAVAKVNSAMASGDIKTVNQKGMDDAVFLAADAANLKAAGLSEAQIAATLKSTGVNQIVAETAAAGVFQGKSTDIIAFNIAAANPNGVYGTGKTGQTQSITAGNNLETLQRSEDALMVAEDATQLKAQGLSTAQIKENLMATGVSEAVATTAANNAGRLTSTALANTLQSTYASTGKNLYGSTENVVGRDLGKVMTAEQTEAYRALPYKASIDSGAITAADANVLKANGYTPEQVVALTTAGYSGSDLVDLASTGVTAATLTTMSNTKIPEGSINDLFAAGASANDIASVSKNLIDTGKLSVASATNILARDFDFNAINSLVTKGINVDAVAKSGLSAGTVNIMGNYGVNLNNVLNAIENGKYTADSVNSLATSRNLTGLQAVSTAGAVTTAVKPGGNVVTGGTTPTTAVDPYAGVVQAGTVTATEASILRANGYTAGDITNLTQLGYSGSDLVDLASTGVPASTLTSMANTQFAESQINDLFRAGASANDISTASNLVNANKLTLDTAGKLLFKDLDSRTITSLSNRGVADIAANSTLSKTALTNIASNTTLDLGKITALQAAGTDVDSMLSKNDIAGLNRLIANTPIVRDASGQYRVTTMDEFNQQFKAQSSGVLAEDLKFIAQDAASLKAQGLNQAQIKAVLMADGASEAAAQYASSFANQGLSAERIEQEIRGRNVTSVYPTVTSITDTGSDITALRSYGQGDTPGQVLRGSDGLDYLTLDNGKVVRLAEYQTALASGKTITIDGQLNTQFKTDLAGVPKYSGMAGTGTPPAGYEVAKPGDVFGPADTNNAQNPFKAGTYLDPETNTWFTPKTVVTTLPEGPSTGTGTGGGEGATGSNIGTITGGGNTTTGTGGGSGTGTGDTGTGTGGGGTGTDAGVIGTITPIIPGDSKSGVVTGPVIPPGGVIGNITTGGNVITVGNTGTPGGNVITVGNTGNTGGNVITVGNTGTPGGNVITVGNTGNTGGNAVVVGNTGNTGGNAVVVGNTGNTGGNAVVVGNTGNTGGNAVVVGNTTGNTITTVLTPVIPGGNTTGNANVITVGNTIGGNANVITVGNTTGNTSNVIIIGIGGNGNANVGNTTGNVTGNITGNTLGNVTGNITGNTLGNVTGNITGNITGNTLGNVTGNITGNTTGNTTGNVVGNTTGNVTGNTSVTGNVIIPITPIIPTDPWTPTPFTPIPFKVLPDLKLPGLNPGFIAPQPYYQNTNQVQSKFFYGARPYQPGPTFDQALYDQVAAPVTPWGLQQMYTPEDLAKYYADQRVSGPVVPR